VGSWGRGTVRRRGRTLQEKKSGTCARASIKRKKKRNFRFEYQEREGDGSKYAATDRWNLKNGGGGKKKREIEVHSYCCEEANVGGVYRWNSALRGKRGKREGGEKKKKKKKKKKRRGGGVMGKETRSKRSMKNPLRRGRVRKEDVENFVGTRDKKGELEGQEKRRSAVQATSCSTSERKKNAGGDKKERKSL